MPRRRIVDIHNISSVNPSIHLLPKVANILGGMSDGYSVTLWFEEPFVPGSQMERWMLTWVFGGAMIEDAKFRMVAGPIKHGGFSTPVFIYGKKLED